MSDRQLPAECDDGVAAVQSWRRLWWLPCELTLELPVSHFTVGELLRLQPGSIVATAWSPSREIPLEANGELIGWTEFEAVGEHRAARITELL
ncbi:MAG TPA: FliM/FliN family flagellar motor C-terminal domain-containing protein [Candidatus Binatia bacterium]|nr:FliM/FliN family flagellar motor C-terminal domain-containing protein [Candidatus Binatia bacterium]